MAQLWGIVPAGGAGTRLWPLSRAGAPKFLLDLTGTGRTLLQQTLDRITPLVDERVVVVTGASHREAVRSQLSGLDPECVVGEPSPRDSMAAIGLAAAMVERRDPEAVVASFHADHVIAPDAALHACVREAAEVAATGLLVTIGVEPTSPATGFGYIHSTGALPGFATAERVDAFVEKPGVGTARRYLADGGYRWNAGMFVAQARVLLDLLGENHPEMALGLRAVAAQPDRLSEIWPELTKIAIDHAVAEPAAAAGRVAVVPARFTWHDVGDLASLAELLPRGDVRVLGDAGQVLALDSSGLIAPHSGRTVVVVGLDDVAVVDTPDAVLVTRMAAAQDVKRVVAELRASGRDGLT